MIVSPDVTQLASGSPRVAPRPLGPVKASFMLPQHLLLSTGLPHASLDTAWGLRSIIHSFIQETATELLFCVVLRPHNEQMQVVPRLTQVLLTAVADGGCFSGLTLGLVWIFALSLNYFVPIFSNFFGNGPPFFLGALYSDRSQIRAQTLSGVPGRQSLELMVKDAVPPNPPCGT